MKGYWKRGSTVGSMDRNGIKSRRALVFRSVPGLVYSNSAFESRNRRPWTPSFTAQQSVCQWRHDEGRHVRQKCQIRHDTVFFCSLLGQSKPTWPRHGELNFGTETYLFWWNIDSLTKRIPQVEIIVYCRCVRNNGRYRFGFPLRGFFFFFF